MLFLKPVFFVWAFVIPAWIIYRLVILQKWKTKSNGTNTNREGLLFLFVVYASAVLAMTILPHRFFGISAPVMVKLNIIPFVNTYHNFIVGLPQPESEYMLLQLQNIIGNFILFIPIGILLPYLFPQLNSFKKIALISFLASFLIECTQYLLRNAGTYRTADIDDIILNTVGGILGWFIAKLLFNRQQSKVRQA